MNKLGHFLFKWGAVFTALHVALAVLCWLDLRSYDAYIEQMSKTGGYVCLSMRTVRLGYVLGMFCWGSISFVIMLTGITLKYMGNKNKFKNKYAHFKF